MWKMAGRKPKPTHLKIVQGTFRKDRANPREPKPIGELTTAPAHFNDEQREVWDYAIANAPKGLLKKIDLSVLEVWVTACVLHREAAKKVAKTGQVVESPSGYPITNPYMSVMNKQAQIMLKAAAEMGFTPASRSRIVVAEEQIGDDPWAKLASDG
jgi:P27 family predicted phage terminase small subunit